MTPRRTFLLIGILSLFSFSCAQKGTPIETGSVPQFVPSSQPDSVIETGIGQDPATAGIFLQWYNVIGAKSYQLRRTDSTNASGIPVGFNLVYNSAANDTTYVDNSGIQTGVTYYYYLQATASDGSRSRPSDTLSYALMDRPILTFPAPNATADSTTIHFSWSDKASGGFTVIRVQDISVIPPVYIWVSKREQIFDGRPSRMFNYDGSATGRLISHHSYHWRVDRFNVDSTGHVYEGARSAWGTFTMN